MSLNVINQTKKCRRCGAYNTAKQEGGMDHPVGRRNDRQWVEQLCFDCHRYLTDHPLEHAEFAEQYRTKWADIFPEFF